MNKETGRKTTVGIQTLPCVSADKLPKPLILQSCAKCAERRHLIWPHGADLVTKLWGSAEDLYRMTGFVASTGLKI